TSNDGYETIPYDDISQSLPLDSSPFHPNRILWVTPHSLFSKAIDVLDMTSILDTPYTGMSDVYRKKVYDMVKSRAPAPNYVISKANWIGLKYAVVDNSGQHVADWKHSWTSVGEATLTFSDGSTHSSHTVRVKNKRWGRRTETFVVNSATFEWVMDSKWMSNNMTLYKCLGEQKIPVGKYSQKWWGGILTGGIFAVDTEELDELVAVLTLGVVLKKKRQRAAERSGGGGG
ncbi:hypothetical protein K432DRAFT_246202, partial [Lepidopterella palustris CBS 459.81]